MLSGNNAISTPLERRELLSCFQYPSPPAPRINATCRRAAPASPSPRVRLSTAATSRGDLRFWAKPLQQPGKHLGFAPPGDGEQNAFARGFVRSSRPAPRLRRRRCPGTRCVTLSAQGFSKQTPPALPAPRAIQGGKKKKKKKKGANWEFDTNRVPREVGEHRGHREQPRDSPGPLGDRPLSPRRWPHLPSSSPRGSTSSGGSTGIGCGGAGRSGSRGWTCGQDRAR